MTVAALLDLGIDHEAFEKELNKLKIDGYAIEIKRRAKEGITGTDFYVHLHEHQYHEEDHDHQHHHHHHSEEHHHHEHGHHHKTHVNEMDHAEAHNHQHRNLYAIENIIDDSGLSTKVKDLSKKIFLYVAEAEAKVHGKPLNEVHFHEVGAIDSIVDIVGAAICIDMLNVDHIFVSPLHIGTGFVTCQHGIIPVPAPATLEILRDVPVYSKGIENELVTPTGAAIAKGLAEDFVHLPPMQIEKIGYGLGKKDLKIKNMLRVVLGKKN